MIRNTFSILNGIGAKLERRLWRNGILTWDDFINAGEIGFISETKKHVFDERLSSASDALNNSDAEYLAKTIKRRDHWRLFDEFKGDAVCLDIETNGFMPDKGGYATMVGIYDGYDYKCFVKGNGLTPDNLMDKLSGFRYLITFYGAAFDIPGLCLTSGSISRISISASARG